MSFFFAYVKCLTTLKQYIKMIKELITYLLKTAKKHNLINSVAYKSAIDINQQNNEMYYQFIIDNEQLLNKQITEGILTLNISTFILGFVTNNDVITVQDNALHIALDIMQYINNNSEYPLQIRDYSILSFSEYSDDNCAGVKLDMQLSIPSPINICTYQENFTETPLEDDIINDLTLYSSDECTRLKSSKNGQIQPLTLKPAKL